MQLVDPPEDDPSCARSLIQPRDLLITIVGANTGHVCVVAETPGKAFVCQSVALVRPVISESAEYINIWLNSEEHGQKYFENCMYGQGRPHLSFDQLGATPIALPPLLELPRIVAEAERQLSVISGIEAQVDHISRRADRLRQSILKRAFSGRLVHHDPNDEPASALLERVRVNANVGATRQVAQKPMTKGRRGTVSPLRETNLAPAFPDDFTSLDSILAAILNRMQPGRQYSRTEIADALGLSTGKWNAAIQELKRRCKVLQVGERRGAKYSRVDQNVNKGDGF
jgi:type I restriction enzyme S subunit